MGSITAYNRLIWGTNIIIEYQVCMAKGFTSIL